MVLWFYVLSISIYPSAATSALTTDQCPRCAAENNQLTVAVSNTKPRCGGPGAGAGAGCGDDQVMIQKEAEEPLNLNFLNFFISAGLRKGGVDKSVPSLDHWLRLGATWLFARGSGYFVEMTEAHLTSTLTPLIICVINRHCLRNPFIRVGVDIDTFNTKYMIWLNGAPDSWFKALPHFKQQLGCSLLWDSVLIGWELCPPADQLQKTGFEAFSVLCDGRMALQMIGEFLPLSLPGSSTKPTLTGNQRSFIKQICHTVLCAVILSMSANQSSHHRQSSCSVHWALWSVKIFRNIV